MPIFLLQLLDHAFFWFHNLFVLFVLLGWTWKRTRRPHLIAVLATAFSWFVLGLRYGIGYCPCTDWHWEVKRRLGETDLPNSHIEYLVHVWTGMRPDPALVDWITLAVFLAALALSLYTNGRDFHSTGRKG